MWFLFKMSFTVRSINLHFKFNQFRFNRLKNSKFRYSPLVRAIEMIQPMSAVCIDGFIAFDFDNVRHNIFELKMSEMFSNWNRIWVKNAWKVFFFLVSKWTFCFHSVIFFLHLWSIQNANQIKQIHENMFINTTVGVRLQGGLSVYD